MKRTFLSLAFSLALGCSSNASDPPAAASGCATATPRVTNVAFERCGVPTFGWLNDPSLGDVTAKGAVETISSSASGVVLAVGKVKVAESHEVQMQQIAYVTQDRGTKLEATALVGWPSDFEQRANLDVVLLLHGTAGFNDSCAPSKGNDTRTLAAALASLGYVVVAPDYIGLRGMGAPTGFLHPYLVAEPTAIASLDAVRAVGKLLAKGDAPVCATTRFATLGGSQGGHAALWVDRVAASYAGELTHVGVVATVPPADLLGESQRALSSFVQASKNVAALFGASSDWYGVKSKLSQVFVPPGDVEIPKAMAASCSPDLGAPKDLAAIFAAPLLEAGKSNDTLRAYAPWGCILVENGLTTTKVARPAPAYPGYGVLFVTGASDQLVNTPIERESFATLCKQGMKMEYLECDGASHTQATTWSLPEITDFIRDRFAGKQPDAAKSCVVAAPSKCRGTP